MNNKLPDFDHLKNRVLTWLQSMKVEGRRFDYKFSPSSGHSLFTTCFALFILDLFRETDNLSNKEKEDWAVNINSYQNKEDGLFYPDPIYHSDQERAVYQASCFCLSALHILGSVPKHRLSVVDQWKTKDAVKQYLYERGVHLGKGGSGNKAMFQAIFLTHEYERTEDPNLLKAIDTWFEFHNNYQNREGYWGIDNSKPYKGLQNAFHQFVIYEYWNREYPRLQTVIENAISLQDEQGHFAPYPGGGACKDYDAIHYLLVDYSASEREMINDVVKNAMHAILNSWNKDGGFCENRFKPISLVDVHQHIIFSIKGDTLQIKIKRVKSLFKDMIKRKKFKNRMWVKEAQPWNESTLWDTWFRCLALFEIGIQNDPALMKEIKFHDHIGLGYLNHVVK